MSILVSPHSLQHLLLSCLFDYSNPTLAIVFLIIVILVAVVWYLIVILVCISLVTNSVEHLFICILAIYVLLDKCLLKFFAQFFINRFYFFPTVLD